MKDQRTLSMLRAVFAVLALTVLGIATADEGGSGAVAGSATSNATARTYNEGVTFLAMIPLITYDVGRVKLNAIYLPKLGHYNEVAAFGFYISIPFGQFAR